MLKVSLIGKFDIQCGGKPIILSSRAAQSLFAYLILTAGTLHRREKLAGMFWPDESEQKARTYLRNELWRIRKAMAQTFNAEYLIASNLTVGFDPSSCWLDVTRFKNVSNTDSAEELIQALSNYQGELLPGFYEDWVVLEREQLHILFEQKIADLLEILEKEQRWRDILEWAERWIAFGQAPEAAYRALLVAYDTLGEHAKVDLTYERCKLALRQLDLEPSEKTRALTFKRSSKIKVPIPLTSFIGREQELKEVAEFLAKSRLVTLTGSGGVGKTRLAIQVVAEVMDLFPDGVWFLDLAPLTDPALVPNTLVNLLGLRESGEIAVTELLINYFSTRKALVIFDNCEHLIDSCAQLIFLFLSSCEHLSVLATSRETLRVSGEIPYRVPSLEIPRSDVEFPIDELSKIESVKLFEERAAFASLNFALNSQNALIISQICQRLDGIPLAIELAAACADMLPLEQIARRLDDRFNLLTQGLRSSLPRQQTLRAMIKWSYDLLTKKERALFKRLTVFAGGWSLKAAEVICVGEGINSSDMINLLSHLVNKSLIVVIEKSQANLKHRSSGDDLRYHMLESIRQFGHEKLMEAGEGEKIRNRHFGYYLQNANLMTSEYFGPKELVWLTWLDEEWDNLRASIAWSIDNCPDAGLELVNCLGYFSLGNLNNLADMLNWLFELVSHPANSPRTAARALGLLHWARYADLSYETSIRIQAMIEEAVSIYEELGDRNGLARALLGIVMTTDNLEVREACFEKALTLLRETNDKAWLAFALLNYGWLLETQNYASKFASLEESLAIYRELGFISGTIEALKPLGALAIGEGNFKLAHLWLDECLSIFQEHSYILGDSTTMSYDLGDLAYYEGDYELAKIFYHNCLSWSKQKGIKVSEAWANVRLGNLYTRLGENEKARMYYREALIPNHKGNTIIVVIATLEGFASLAVAECQWERAIKLFSWSTKQREEMRDLRLPIEQAAVDRDLAILHSHLTDQDIIDLSAEGRQMSMEQAIVFV